MDKRTESVNNRECIVNIENIKFHLLIDTPNKGSDSEEDVCIFHSHVSAELFACCVESMTLATKGEVLILNRGDVAVVPPGIPHCMLSTDESAENCVISFICDKRENQNVRDLYNILSPFIVAESILIYRGRSDICACVSEVVRIGQSETGILPALKAVELLIGLTESVDEKRRYTTVDKRAEGRYDIYRMMKLDTIITSSYMKGLTMKEIADELYISSRQLDRVVRKRYGEPLHKVIMKTRVGVAERMLRTTDMTVQEIGRAVGFSSGAGFYREFVRAYGVTPAEYRKKAR